MNRNIPIHKPGEDFQINWETNYVLEASFDRAQLKIGTKPITILKCDDGTYCLYTGLTGRNVRKNDLTIDGVVETLIEIEKEEFPDVVRNDT